MQNKIFKYFEILISSKQDCYFIDNRYARNIMGVYYTDEYKYFLNLGVLL